jgi:manganese transport protein
VIGSAIALNLLFGIPIAWGVGLTALDVLLVLYLQNKGFRLIEALVIALVGTIGACFLFEIVRSRPDVAAVLGGFVPTRQVVQDSSMLYLALGILGATVMPHNLYLHSSIVQTRKYEENATGKREAVRYAFVDSTIALTFALFINASILVVAAATFHSPATPRWRRSRTRTSCSRRSSARGRAPSSRSRCSRRGRAPPSPAPSRGRS